MSKSWRKQIDPVKDKMDKGNTYRCHCDSYSKAFDAEFYLQAIAIAYAMIEDRLRSFYYHTGIIEEPLQHVTEINNPQIKDCVLKIAETYLDADTFSRTIERPQKGPAKVKVDSISRKINILFAMLTCLKEEQEPVSDGSYHSLLMSALAKAKKQNLALLDKLEDIREWLAYRNEITHALLNKSVESLNKKLRAKAKAGREFADQIDNFARRIKRTRLRQKRGLSE